MNDLPVVCRKLNARSFVWHESGPPPVEDSNSARVKTACNTTTLRSYSEDLSFDEATLRSKATDSFALPHVGTKKTHRVSSRNARLYLPRFLNARSERKINALHVRKYPVLLGRDPESTGKECFR